MNHYRCAQTWIPVRKEPSGASEMVNSMLFGETCSGVIAAEDWLEVDLDYDGYKGFVPEYYLQKITAEEQQWDRVLCNQSSFFSDGVSKIHISAGSSLPRENKVVLDGHDFYLTIRDPYIPANLWELAKGFLYVPYLWGGRSDCGIDCSGLTQVCAKMKGIKIPRDAKDQVSVGEEIPWAERGENDLAFFEKNGRVTHVGILTDELKIIHASGRVKLDFLIQEGIRTISGNSITHRLHSIRRIC